MTGDYLHGDSAARKRAPMCEALLWYFRDALAAVAAHSSESNEKHNPGQRVHWAREKSTDHADCIIRHLCDAAPVTLEGIEARAAVAWRALAFLQEGLEALYDLPLPPNASVSKPGNAPLYDPDDVAFRKRNVSELTSEGQSWGMYDAGFIPPEAKDFDEVNVIPTGECRKLDWAAKRALRDY